MKVYFAKDERGNFGDDLNLVLWPKLLPELDGAEDGKLLVGVGTLLNERVPVEPFKHVFGSGAGYGAKPVIDGRWKFHAVRGPITAQLLELDPSMAVTDSGVLAVHLVDPAWRNASRIPVSFMPHHMTDFFADWQSICEEAGVHFISPCSSWDVVMREICRSERLITEAMHGAIIADALRVPWTAVSIGPCFNQEKWLDWGLSVGVTPEMVPIPYLSELRSRLSPLDSTKQAVKRALYGSPLWSKAWAKPVPADTPPTLRQEAVQAIRNVAKNRPFVLSDSGLLATKISILEERLDKLRIELRK
jgi:succinoglycan biosynthesis protein ExoV